MVGRTPEFMGKIIEAREMKIAMIIALLHPFLILVGTALATAFPKQGASTLNNPAITASAKFCMNIRPLRPTTEAALKDWATIIYGGISPQVLC